VEINSEIASLLDLSTKTTRECVNAALQNIGVGIEAQQSVLKELDSCRDKILETFKKFRHSKQIEKYLTSNFNVILPEKKILGKGTFQYVPIAKVLTKIVADKSFQNCLQRSRAESNTNKNVLEDLHDGILFRESSYFRENPEAIRYF
jgi:hypothetical protein